MRRIVLHPTEVGQWRELVGEASRSCSVSLDEDLESYLVFLLMRFIGRAELAGNVLALEYLQSLTGGSQSAQQLRDVGDKCLLYSGLFPLRARRRLVRVRYYIDLGRGAYQRLSDQARYSYGQMFERLATHFIPLMDVLQAMRDLDGERGVDPLLLHELAGECQSERAAQRLGEHFGAAWVDSCPDRKH